jgi:hypothetical protein
LVFVIHAACLMYGRIWTFINNITQMSLQLNKYPYSATWQSAWIKIPDI